MENKQTAPKEIWIHWSAHKDLQKDVNVTLFATISNYHINDVEEYKYIHSSEVERLLAEKDATINRMGDKISETVKYLGSVEKEYRLYKQTEEGRIDLLKKELADKDAEIKALKTKLQIRENLNRNANREDI